MRKKLRSQRGDTLVETLAALLIVVLTMAFLATSIVTAAASTPVCGRRTPPCTMTAVPPLSRKR